MSSLKQEQAEAQPNTPMERREQADTASGSDQPAISEVRHRLICEAAYFRAERREFACDAELEDWLAAEKEIDARLAENSDSAGGSSGGVRAPRST